MRSWRKKAGPGELSRTSRASTPSIGDEHEQAGCRQPGVDGPLQHAVEAAQRDVVDVDDRDAVEFLEAGAQRDHLDEVRHDLDLDDLAVGALDQPDHLHVLVERQGDVELIDPIALQDVAGFGQRAEQRQAAIADVVAAGLVVDEADHLVAELVVLEQLVDDHPAELAGAGDEDALEADAWRQRRSSASRTSSRVA